ncbi:hypothetical protein ACXIUS_30135 [Bosea thiooxidans]
MAYPLDQLITLTKANLDLSMRLAEIAHTGNRATIQTASKAAGSFAEVARTGKDTGLFDEAKTLHEQITADTLAALEA